MPNYVQWRYKNSWRPFCDRWWWHWFDLRLLWWDLQDAWARARYGYAPGDIFDMCSYHAGVTRGLMKEFLDRHHGYPFGMEPEEYTAKLQVILDGWEAMETLVGDDWVGVESYDAWRAPLEERWRNGMKEFTELYVSFWQ